MTFREQHEGQFEEEYRVAMVPVDRIRNGASAGFNQGYRMAGEFMPLMPQWFRDWAEWSNWMQVGFVQGYDAFWIYVDAFGVSVDQFWIDAEAAQKK